MNIYERAKEAYKQEQRAALRRQRNALKSHLRQIKQHMVDVFGFDLDGIRICSEKFDGFDDCKLVATAEGLRFAVDMRFLPDYGPMPIVQLIPDLALIRQWHCGVMSEDTYNEYELRSDVIRTLAELGALLVDYRPHSGNHNP